MPTLPRRTAHQQQQCIQHTRCSHLQHESKKKTLECSHSAAASWADLVAGGAKFFQRQDTQHKVLVVQEGVEGRAVHLLNAAVAQAVCSTKECIEAASEIDQGAG